MASASAKRGTRRPGRLHNKLSFASHFNDENASPFPLPLSKPSPTLLADVTTPALPLPVETVTDSEEVHPVGLAAVTQWFDGSVKPGNPQTGRSAVRSALQDFSDNSFFSFPSGKSAAMSVLGVRSVNENNRRNSAVPAPSVPQESTQSLVEVLPPNTLKATELMPSVPIVPPRLSASVRQSISGAPPFLGNYTSSSAGGLGSAPSSRRTSLSFAGSLDGSVSSSSAALAFPPPPWTGQRRISALAESAGDFSAMLPDEREFLVDVAEFHGLPVRASLQSLPPLAESYPPQARQAGGAGKRMSLAWMSLDGKVQNVEALTEIVGASGMLTENERHAWLSIPAVYRALILAMTWKSVSTARMQMKREFARIRKLIRAKDMEARSLRKKIVALRSQPPRSVVSSPVASPSSGVARVAEGGPSPARASEEESQVQQLLQAKDEELKRLEEQMKRAEEERDEMGGKMKRAAEEVKRMEEQLKDREECMREEMKRADEGRELAVREMKRMEAEMKRMAEEMKRAEERCGEVEASRVATQEALNAAVESNSALRDMMALQAAHIAELKALILGQTEAIQGLTRGSAPLDGADAGKPARGEGEGEGEEETEEEEKAGDARKAGMEELMEMLSHQSAEISALSRAVQASTSSLCPRSPSPSASPSASPEPDTPLAAKPLEAAGGGAGGSAGAGGPGEPGLWRMGLPLLGSPLGCTPSPPGRGEMRVVARIRGNVYGAVPKYGGAGMDGVCGGEGSSSSSYSVNGAAPVVAERKASMGIGRNGGGTSLVPPLTLQQGPGPVDPVDPVDPVGPVDPVDCAGGPSGAAGAGEGKGGSGGAEGERENGEVLREGGEEEHEGEEGHEGEEYEEAQQFFSAPATPFSSVPSTPTAAAAAAAAVVGARSVFSMAKDTHAAEGEEAKENEEEQQEQQQQEQRQQEQQQQKAKQQQGLKESGKGRASDASGSMFRVGGIFDQGTVTSSTARAEKARKVAKPKSALVAPGSTSSSRLGRLVRAESQPQGRVASRKLSMECGGGRGGGEGDRGGVRRGSVLEGGMVRSRSERTPYTPPHAPPNTPDASGARLQGSGKAGGVGEGLEGRALRESGRANSRDGEGRSAQGKGVQSASKQRWKY
ncbi:hypothetical protein CLOM_g10008 [Closterium sp. NIES-68]|nr:hypothetical protein CLOM_g10008 [Closterium sp. NIES-68]GJP68383.1 hypothetical protein CLOP_g25103 [Closterium sp. NIES-67]